MSTDIKAEITPWIHQVFELVVGQGEEPQVKRMTKDQVVLGLTGVLGYETSSGDLNRICNFNDWRDDHVCDLETFERIAKQLLIFTTSQDFVRQAFHAIDLSKKGFISQTDFYKAVRKVAPNLSDYVIEQAFAQVDRDRDGRVSFRELEMVMRT
eukprot:m.224232 g.224232  ORF g.224232 m.224232 type:complete len:154 (-) comp15948_c0_seq8:1931-2392(-)